MIELLETLSHPDTRITCLSERILMYTLEGGCTVPIGVNTKLKSDSLWMRDLVSKSTEERKDLVDELGVSVVTKLFDHGADKS
ncbi:hypothetical protein BD770DRAFT_440426 [Pilaira anomala]|nr:hypothetical protein BD770DRAFT_440426 [Pilaira anomala]